MRLHWSEQWLLVPSDSSDDGTGPVLTAGPDVRYELAGLDPISLDSAIGWQATGSLDPDQPLDAASAELRDLLVGLGALLPVGGPDLVVTVTGDPPRPLLDRLADIGPWSLESTTGSPPATPASSVELVFRTRTDWPRPGDGVHLGIDLTHHHTLVLGPLVVPGVTSCLRCLDRLITRHWGVDQVPDAPAIQRRHAIAAELIAVQLDALLAGNSALPNRTIAWDLRGGSIESEALLRAPECGGPCTTPTIDRLDLPWVT